MRRDTLLDFFSDFATLPNEFIIHDDGFRTRSFRYSDVARLARGFAARLREAGVSRGRNVILYCENRPEWVIALWGCLLEGVVAVPIDYRLSIAFVDRIRALVDARVILIGDEVEYPRSGRRMARRQHRRPP